MAKFHNVSYIIISFISLYRVIILAYFISSDGLDLKFFTYINYTLVTMSFMALLLSSWSYVYYSIYCLFIWPITFGVTLFVSIAIVIIIQLNDKLFIKSTTENGGHHTIGLVHTADFFIHQLPALEVAIIAICLIRTSSIIFNNFVKKMNKIQKAFYSIYFLCCSLFLLGLYMITMDFGKNYPTKLPNYLIYLIVICSSIFLNSLLYLLHYFYPDSNLDIRQKQK
jgi:hypothetical protein